MTMITKVKSCISKKDTVLAIAVALAVAFAVPSVVSYVRADSSSNHWQIGHDDACNNGQIAPGSHTQDYMNGFNQGLADCNKNSRSGSSSSNPNLVLAHTAAYNAGFTQGLRDKNVNHSHETPSDMCASADYTGIELQHCIVGYNDGYNSVSSTTGPSLSYLSPNKNNGPSSGSRSNSPTLSPSTGGNDNNGSSFSRPSPSTSSQDLTGASNIGSALAMWDKSHRIDRTAESALGDLNLNMTNDEKQAFINGYTSMAHPEPSSPIF
jgi:hypothetical protein